MRKVIFLSLLLMMLSGCGDIGKYDGVYACGISQALNDKTIEYGGDYVFPKDTKKAKIKLENAVLTIYGMNSGDYIGHKMSKPSKDDINDDVYDGDFFYKKDGIMEAFSFDRKLATLTINREGMKSIQQFSGCKKQ
ncbi:TPA: hypothetical protein SLH24_003779 [Proteus mirabilis]|nr:hypothetical protein [Proteus mirabilis]